MAAVEELEVPAEDVVEQVQEQSDVAAEEATAQSEAEAEEEEAPTMAQEPPAEKKPVVQQATPEKTKKKQKRRKSVEAGLAIPDVVTEAIKECRKLDSDVNGVIIELLKNGRKFSLSSDVQVYTGGVPEVCEYLESQGSGRILYCYLKIHGEDDLSLQIDRFIFVKYQPDDCNVMLRAQSGTFDNQMQNLLKHHMKLQVDQDFGTHLSFAALAKQIMRNMGSDKPQRLTFAPGQVWDVADGSLIN